jgi:hypothetical protein
MPMNSGIHCYLISGHEKGNFEFHRNGRWDVEYQEVYACSDNRKHCAV